MNDKPPDGIAIASREGREVLVWRIEGLWESSRELPIEMIPLDYFDPLLDEPPEWYVDGEPTLREVAQRAKRIYEADLSCPVIISAEGYLMDGKHRLAKASLLGMKEIAAVRFRENPAPDWRKPKS